MNERILDDLIDFGFGVFVTAVGVGVLLFVVLGAADFLMDRHTFAQQVACEQRQMQPERKALSTVVICVPRPTRRDTLGIEQVGPR